MSIPAVKPNASVAPRIPEAVQPASTPMVAAKSVQTAVQPSVSKLREVASDGREPHGQTPQPPASMADVLQGCLIGIACFFILGFAGWFVVRVLIAIFGGSGSAEISWSFRFQQLIYGAAATVIAFVCIAIDEKWFKEKNEGALSSLAVVAAVAFLYAIFSGIRLVWSFF